MPYTIPERNREGKDGEATTSFSLAETKQSFHKFEEPLYIFHENLGLHSTCRPVWTRIACTDQKKVKWQFDSSHWLLPPWGVELQIPEGYLAFPSLGMRGSQSYCPVLISNKSIFAKLESQRLPRQLSEKWKWTVSSSLSSHIWFS